MDRAFVLTNFYGYLLLKEHPYTPTDACEAGSPSHKDVFKGGEEAIDISLTYKEAMVCSQDKELSIVMNKELDSLKQHQPFDTVPIRTDLPNRKVIGSRFAFKQKATGPYK